MEPELREEENQLAQTDKKILRTELEYSARLKPHDSLAKSPSGRLAKYFSGEKGIFIPGQSGLTCLCCQVQDMPGRSGRPLSRWRS